jgi:hypothetical protein
MLMSIGIYLPWFKRVVSRRHTRDFSKISAWFVFLVQLNGLLLAAVENAPFLEVWYVSQATLSFLQLILIYQFWGNPEPGEFN